MSVYVRTLKYFRPYGPATFLAILFTIGAIGMNLLKPWPFKFIVDGVLSPPGSPGRASASAFLHHWMPAMSEINRIFLLCLILVGIHLCWGLLNLGANYIFVKVGLQALLKLRTELYAYLQQLSLKFHDARKSSDSAYRVAYDAQSIQTIYSKGFVSVFSSLVMLFGALLVMFRIHWQLTLASLAVLPVVVWVIHRFANRIRTQSLHIHEKESALLSGIQEGISSIRLVQAFNRESFEIGRFQEYAEHSLTANLRLNVTTVVSSLVIGVLMAIGTAILYFVGSAEVLHAQLSLGDLLVFSAYLILLYQPLEQLTYTAWAMEGAAAGAQRCIEVLDRQDDVLQKPDARPLPQGGNSRKIEFIDVGFSYSGSRQILKSVNLTIQCGESVAVVGGTGAGKSTLISLVPRFYDPTKGVVQIGGIDLRDLTKDSLRAQIGLVLQDTLLFSTTVRENIAYGRPDAKLEEIIEASRQAQALEFIEDLPDGFDSLIGERGTHLSVGQRQRLGIARAFLKNAPILLLDEPTSALDPSTEAAIMETMRELMKGRTTLIVTHRIATIHQIGRIVVLKSGRIIEEGTGPQLLARGGAYASLYQSGNYSGEG